LEGLSRSAVSFVSFLNLTFDILVSALTIRPPLNLTVHQVDVYRAVLGVGQCLHDAHSHIKV
jgi:hypothetical protein